MTNVITCLKSVEKVLSNKDLTRMIAEYLPLDIIRNISTTCKYLTYLVTDETLLQVLHKYYYNRVDNICSFRQKINAIYNMKLAKYNVSIKDIDKNIDVVSYVSGKLIYALKYPLSTDQLYVYDIKTYELSTITLDTDIYNIKIYQNNIVGYYSTKNIIVFDITGNKICNIKSDSGICSFQLCDSNIIYDTDESGIVIFDIYENKVIKKFTAFHGINCHVIKNNVYMYGQDVILKYNITTDEMTTIKYKYWITHCTSINEDLIHFGGERKDYNSKFKTRAHRSPPYILTTENCQLSDKSYKQVVVSNCCDKLYIDKNKYIILDRIGLIYILLINDKRKGCMLKNIAKINCDKYCDRKSIIVSSDTEIFIITDDKLYILNFDI
ncbi:MAG: hypothetical protein Faunusvirus56_3 [Faunusvirus sp.]|uniref:Uncharacterized protein n=1 Tax=Faunusvirus sp. TaxID=2487766 RepID=A0A3G4ZY76_9VIRU|nr:MAG: hypothetical protein Faunusvirus56_3 [Faunusvirus sp.]